MCDRLTKVDFNRVMMKCFLFRGTGDVWVFKKNEMVIGVWVFEECWYSEERISRIVKILNFLKILIDF